MENTSHSTNPFRRLFQIDVSTHVEKKGLFSYLSWPFAVAQLRLADPDASWEVRRFDGLPYLSSELGFFVEVAVTVQGVTRSQIHPVLDNKNRPVLAPMPFDINTSIQRCLVKAIALHGLGLSIYAGEELPDLEDAGNTGNSGKTGKTGKTGEGASRSQYLWPVLSQSRRADLRRRVDRRDQVPGQGMHFHPLEGRCRWPDTRTLRRTPVDGIEGGYGASVRL